MAKKTARKVVKKSPRKAPKKAVRKTPNKKQSQAPQVIGLVILVIVAFFLIYFGVSSLMPSSAPADVPVVAAVVGDVEITSEQLQTQYAILPPQYKAMYSEQMILQQLIDEELLLAYGASQGLSVSDEEVNEEIQRVLSSGQLTLVELQENLKNFNLTVDDFEGLIGRKLMIEKSMDALLKDVPPPTEADARAFYDENSAQFVSEEQVTVRHILIASQREDAAQFSKDLLDQIKEGADFCALVEEETDDKGSVETCGEYTFPRGYMVPEFEEASFELAPGDLTLVQSQFGYHIIEKLADVPAGIVSFDEAEEGIVAQLTQQNGLAVYQDFLATAKNETDIQIFY